VKPGGVRVAHPVPAHVSSSRGGHPTRGMAIGS
jgi:hypothetical protein